MALLNSKLTAVTPNVQNIELQSEGKVTQKVVAQAGQSFKILIDGQVYTGQKKVNNRELRLVRKGDKLLLIARYQDEPLLEVSGFYAPAESTDSTVEDHAQLSSHGTATETLADLQSLFENGSSTHLAAADLGASSAAVTPSWGTLIAQAGSAAGTTTAVTATTATAATAVGAVSAGGAVAAFAIAAAAINIINDDSSSGTPAEETPTLTPRDYTIDVVFGPMTDGGVNTSIYLYKADGTKLDGDGKATFADGKFTFTDTKGYGGVVIVKMVDGDTDPDYRDEATGELKSADGVYLSVVDATGGTVAIKVSINPLTTAAAISMGVTNPVTNNDSDPPTIAADIKSGNVTTAAAKVVSVNKAIAKAFNVVDDSGNAIDISISTAQAVVDANGDAATGNAYGRALAIVSQAEKASGKSTAEMTADVAKALNVDDGNLTGSKKPLDEGYADDAANAAAVQAAITTGVASAQASAQMTQAQSSGVVKSMSASPITMVVEQIEGEGPDSYLNAAETAVSFVLSGSFAAGQKLQLFNGTTAIDFMMGDASVDGSVGHSFTAAAQEIIITVMKVDLTDNASNSLKATVSQGTSEVIGTVNSNLQVIVVDSLPTVPLASYTDSTNGVSGNDVDMVTNTAAITAPTNLEKGSKVEYRVTKGTGEPGAWSTTYTAPSADGNNDGDYEVEVRSTDLAGNQAIQTINFTLDGTKPGVTDAALTQDTAAGNTINTDGITKNGAVLAPTNVETGAKLEYRVTKGTGEPGAWSATYTAPLTDGSADGVYKVEVRQIDKAGNEGAVQVLDFTVDNTAPTAPTIDLGAGVADGVTAAEAIASSGVVTVTADADASVVVTMTNSADNTKTLTKTVTGMGSAQAVTLTAEDLTMLGDGTINVGAVATDAAGNASEAGAASFSLDTTAPTVAITSDLNALKAGETAVITFTFSEAPVGFTDADLTVAGGTLTDVTVNQTDAKIYTAMFTPTVNSTAAASITVSTGYTDAAGNTGGAGTTPTITIDTIAPTVAITSNKNALKAGETAVITFTFTEAPTGFDATDVMVTGGTLSAITGSGLTRTATFTPAVNSSAAASITVSTGYTDAAGNTGGVGTTPTITIDTIAPTVAITSSKSALKAGETALITFTFTEAPTGFDATDVMVTGGMLSAITGSGLTRTATFTPTVNSTAAASITVSTGYTDAAGNTGGAGTTPTITIDTAAPTPMLAIASGEDAFVNSAESNVTLVYTDAEMVAGDVIQLKQASSALGAAHTVTDVEVSSGRISFVIAKSDLGTDGEKSITAETTDAAGNVGISSAVAVTLDTEPPTITTTSLSAAENATAVGTVLSSDTDGVMWTLAGTDADNSLFSITAGGELTLKEGKNFEAPGSATMSNDYTVKVKATDSSGNVTTKDITVNVTDVNDAPTTVNSITAKTAVLNQTAWTLNLADYFDDVDAVDTHSFAITAGTLPAGLMLNPTSGVISGTPTVEATNSSYTVTVTDSGGLTATQTFSLAVLSAPALTTTLSSAVTNLDVRSKIVFSVGETVTAISGGTITLTDLGGTGFQGDVTTNNQIIDITDTTRVKIVGTGADTKIIIDPQFDLDLSSNYNLDVSEGAFQGTATGLSSVAFDTVNFSTVTPAASFAVAQAAVAAQEMNENTGILDDTLKWFDITDLGTPSGSAKPLAFGSGDYAATMKYSHTENDSPVLEGDVYVLLENFGADDLLYFDNQDHTNLGAESQIYNNAFDRGFGTIDDPFGIRVSSNGDLAAAYIDIYVAPEIDLGDIDESGLIQYVTRNGWSNTDMVIVA